MDPPSASNTSPGTLMTVLPLTPQVFEDEEALGWELACRIVEGIAVAEREKRAYLLGCPGGRSLRSTYRMLGKVAADQSADLSPLVIVMMDDYVAKTDNGFVQVPIEAHYSCRRFAIEWIATPLAGLSGAPDRTRVWMPDPADPCAYDRLLAEAGGIDLFLLASGASDGHIAFNPSGSPRDSTTRIVELSTYTRIDNMTTFPEFESLDQVPTYGVTVGIGTIAELSKSAVMVCLGPEKQETVKRMTAARSYEPSWPATIISEISNAELWIHLSVT